jgi:dCMP deaminase
MFGLSRTILTEKAWKLFESWFVNGSYEKVERPDWDEYFIKMAYHVATRSMDAQTQHGCVITDRDHRILGTGYNSFIREINNEVLPNLRPDKYPFMVHSEPNAIFNCTLPPKNGIAYITGPPCPQCLQFMWQAGIRRIVVGTRKAHMLTSDPDKEPTSEILMVLLKQKGLVYEEVEYVPEIF